MTDLAEILRKLLPTAKPSFAEALPVETLLLRLAGGAERGAINEDDAATLRRLRDGILTRLHGYESMKTRREALISELGFKSESGRPRADDSRKRELAKAFWAKRFYDQASYQEALETAADHCNVSGKTVERAVKSCPNVCKRTAEEVKPLVDHGDWIDNIASDH